MATVFAAEELDGSPTKRRRIGKHDTSGGDLRKKREQNDNRLKSIFESIFEKYERDFDGIGDEIDLETGSVVVDNGHISGMKYEADAGTGIEDLEIDTNCGFSDSEHSEASLYSSVEDYDDALADETIGPFSNDHDAGSTIKDPGKLHNLFGEGLADSVPTLYDDEDELAIGGHHSALPNGLSNLGGNPAAFIRERRNARDPKWQAPPLPDGAMENRPVHRRMTLPAPIQVKARNVDLGDWRQISSVWDVRPSRVRSRPASHSGTHLEAEIEPIWTQSQQEAFRYLKRYTTMPFSELVKYFPGQTEQSLAAFSAESEGLQKAHDPSDEHSTQHKVNESACEPSKNTQHHVEVVDKDVSPYEIPHIMHPAGLPQPLGNLSPPSKFKKSHSYRDGVISRSDKDVDADIWEVPDFDMDSMHRRPGNLSSFVPNSSGKKSGKDLEQDSSGLDHLREIQDSDPIVLWPSPPDDLYSDPLSDFGNLYDSPRPSMQRIPRKQYILRESSVIKDHGISPACERQQLTSRPNHLPRKSLVNIRNKVASSKRQEKFDQPVTSSSVKRHTPSSNFKGRGRNLAQQQHEQIPLIDLTTPDSESIPHDVLIDTVSKPIQKYNSKLVTIDVKSTNTQEIPDSQPSQSERRLSNEGFKSKTFGVKEYIVDANTRTSSYKELCERPVVRVPAPIPTKAEVYAPSTPKPAILLSKGSGTPRKCQDQINPIELPGSQSKVNETKTHASLSLSMLCDGSDDDLSTPILSTKRVKKKEVSSTKPRIPDLPQLHSGALSDDELG
ncbi:uncharacterized protein KY384_008530 [Bacidia gigantensis]|uniref:uncharacterized protein n=1 Tax=Bacidia gigantensis TaxID=2732470 RepID=UPI001D048951|nr:uncharacterized protein KY384_008530 [Bacidia gigantensis]KAG8527101.1 hypothetical protein KY384_008530 [Bacidia gigantensis]